MSDTENELDIAQRIAAALQQTAAPQPISGAQPVPADETVIGEVPEHLRHLHNLLVDLGAEAKEAQRQSLEARERHMLVQALFAESLKQHLPKLGEGYDGVRLCEGWQVTGYVENDQDGDGLEGMVMAAMGGRRH
jgi:hypothetical protein